MQLKTLIYIAIGGFIGTIVRYEVFNVIDSSPRQFPTDTFVVNIAGAFIVGTVATIILLLTKAPTLIRPMILIGFCGALTTESTMAVNFDRLISYNQLLTGSVFLVSMIICGFMAIFIGNRLALLISGK